MSKIVWDAPKDRLYETGVSNGVLYVQDDSGAYRHGIPWNGLTGVTNTGNGAEGTVFYADNIKYVTAYSRDEFGLTIEAWTYPDEFLECDGSKIPVVGEDIKQQFRRTFGFSYKTILGNALDGNDLGYKLHIIYGCKASPTDRQYQVEADTVELTSFSWDVSTTPIEVEGFKPTSEVVLDSTLVSSDAMAEIEKWLYGSETNEPTLMMPGEIREIVSLNSIWFYSYTDPKDNGNVLIKKKANRIQTYSYTDEDYGGSVMIQPLSDRTYRYSDTSGEGDILIEEVTP